MSYKRARPLGPLFLVLLCLTACRDPEGARKALDDAGFSDIQIVDPTSWFSSCSKSDSYETHFIATNIRGKRVTGAVCAGSSKGATIRFD